MDVLLQIAGQDAPPTGGERMCYYEQRGKMPRLQGRASPRGTFRFTIPILGTIEY